MIKEFNWLKYFCYVWIGKDITEVNPRMTNLWCLTMTLCMVEMGHDPWPQQGMLSSKMFKWLHNRKSKLFFLWNMALIWSFYRIAYFCEICHWLLTFMTEVRVEPDPRTLIRGHWRAPHLVSSLPLFCRVSRIYMNVHVGYLSFCIFFVIE